MGSESGREGEDIHRPLLSVCGIGARASIYSRDTFLLASCLLGMVANIVDVDLATGGKKAGKTNVHG
jgi:hypothetical protein